MAPPRPPPALIDDLLGEILLRLPPDDPACLVRASLVCKPWRRLLSDRGFLRSYRAFHRTPPVLGFFHDLYPDSRIVPRFVPTTEASPIPQPPRGCCTLDCRHGRVLIHTFRPSGLVVWDPITGGQQRLRQPVNPYEHDEYDYFSAAVLCASDGCDHLECRGRPFLVVFAGTDIRDPHGDDEDGVTWASVYSSETGAWSAQVSVHLGPILDSVDVMGSSLLAGDALYFTLEEGHRILKYDFSRRVLSVINPPPRHVQNMVLVRAEDGGLGVAGVAGYSLHLWSWRAGPSGVSEWAQGRVIELDMMISISIGDPSTRLHAVGFAEGADSIFISANASIFRVGLRSGQVRKIGKKGDFTTIFPFMSFYTPDHASSRLRVALRTE